MFKKHPPKIILFLIKLMGVIGGLMWLILLTGVLVDLVEFIHTVYGIDKTYLGLTILSFGTSMPDFLTIYFLARQTEKMVIVSEVFIEQMFAVIFGFGIAMLRLTLKDGPQRFDLFDIRQIGENIIVLVMLGFLLVLLVVTIAFAYSQDYWLGIKFAQF